MRKQISTAKVKKLPLSTDVWVVDEKTGYSQRLFLVRYGNKLRLKSAFGDWIKMIKDTPGYHYEVEEA